jgi:hypothetical protein
MREALLLKRGLGKNKMEGIIIQSNSISVKNGQLRMNGINDDVFTPGNMVLEGDDPEEVCVRSSKEKIIKPLHPFISWKELGSKKFPIIYLNYLTETENV